MFFRKKKQEMVPRGDWMKVDYRGEDIFVWLHGRLDHTLSNTIRPALGALLARQIEGSICLRMVDVFLLDISTAVALVAFFKDAERCDVTVEVWGASPVVKRVFEGLGVGELLTR